MNEWKIIEFGEGRYSISPDGQVKNNVTGQIMKTQVQNSGYEHVGLNHKGFRKAFTVHRLVALAFVDNIGGKSFVDHIDNNKRNNSASNLRWVTGKENMEYAVLNGCLKNAAKGASVRMKALGNKYGFDNSQKYLKKAIPVNLIINGKAIQFRSGRQASIHLKIDHKTLANRIKRGIYSKS